METIIESVAVVRNEHGYTAHLRFRKPWLNRDISADNYYAIHERVDRILDYVCGRELKGNWR